MISNDWQRHFVDQENLERDSIGKKQTYSQESCKSLLLQLCELNLDETELTGKCDAEVSKDEFNHEWEK
ncbi:hypothetical protein K0M31_006669 [Melipona bicolor]|uniref:Myosin VI cargo binding domain-containing protein n=1 Tax=Melipona bicolor TaxID=60889 RepID=A0AA40FSX7_9HYME|nr:hypothetical protein K0M31_006669 [Melipona bicolor]